MCLNLERKIVSDIYVNHGISSTRIIAILNYLIVRYVVITKEDNLRLLLALQYFKNIFAPLSANQNIIHALAFLFHL